MLARAARSLLAVALGVTLVAGCSDEETPPTAADPAETARMSAAPSAAPTTAAPSPEASSPTPAPSPSTSRPPASTTDVVAVSFADGKAKPGEKRVTVRRGNRVSLEVTSDVADEVHVHGYDRFADLKANGTTTLSFKASKAGLYEVEAEEAGIVLVQLLVK